MEKIHKEALLSFRKKVTGGNNVTCSVCVINNSQVLVIAANRIQKYTFFFDRDRKKEYNDANDRM